MPGSELDANKAQEQNITKISGVIIHLTCDILKIYFLFDFTQFLVLVNNKYMSYQNSFEYYDLVPLEKQFDKACALLRAQKDKLNGDTMLQLYALFKQTLYGDCNIIEPGFFQFKEKKKYDAWYALKGMSKADAMRRYIDCARYLFPGFDPSQ